jgi:hypothetical protein
MLARFYQAPGVREVIRAPLRRGRSGKGKILFFSLSLIFAPSFVTGTAYGQQSNAATTKVVGTVFVQDPAGNRSVVVGATVKLDGPATLETETDQNGNYLVAAVPSGTYTVEGVSPGLEIRKTLRVEGDEVTVPLELKPAELNSSVVVKADQPDITSSAPAETISAKALEDAPNVNERFESSLPLVPGVVRGPDGRINLKGARDTQSGELVNSANVTDPVTGSPAINLPIDVVQSVEVISNPYDPEYGRFTGAVSTVDTKTGNFDGYHFSIQNIFPRVRDRDGHIMGIGASTPRATLTGPLIKGRLSFTQSFEYRYIYTPVNSLPYYERDTKLESFDSYTQLDANISSKQTATISFALYPQKLDYLGLNTFTTQLSTPDFHQHGYQIYAQHHWVIGEGGLLTSQFSYKTFDADITAQNNDPYILQLETTEGGFFNRQKRTTSRASWEENYHFAPWRFLGSHQFAVGLSYEHSAYNGNQTFLPVEIEGVSNLPVELISFTPSTSFHVNQNETAWYAGDTWTVNSRLTVSLGLRFDNDSITHSTHAAPRVGFLVALTKDGKTLLKGGAGLFYDRVPLMIPTFVDLPDRTVTLLGPTGAAASSVSYQNEILSPLQNPRSASWNLELDRQVLAGLFLRVAYEQRNTTRDFVVSPTSDGAAGILGLSNDGSDSYREYQVSARYQVHRFLLNASYVRSRAFGDLNDFNQFFGNLAQPVIQPDARARLPFDAPNRFLFWGTFAGPLKLTIAPLYDIHSGFPYSPQDEYRDYVGPRDVDRFPRFASFDLQVTRPISLHFGEKRLHARVGGTAFNLFNHFDPRDVQNNLASVRFGEFFNSSWREYRGKFVVEF